MRIEATRTLVKSPPELWELLDDEPQLRDWSSRLCGDGVEVEVVEREPGRLLAWRCEGAAVDVALAEKGFGTRVEIRAEGSKQLDQGALEQLLDELVEPQRRPFRAA